MSTSAGILTVGLAACAALAAPLPREAHDAGTVYLGAIVGQDWGRPVTSGDLDGDGYDEIIVAASKASGGFTSRVYVMRGGAEANSRGPLDLSTSGIDQVILGVSPDDNLGASMATGDVNGDEIDDLLLCASAATFGDRVWAGEAYVIFGGAGFFDSPTRDLSVDANWDMRIGGPVASGDMGGANMFGGLDTHAAAIGRLNNDQYGDIIVGVHLADGGASQAGRVYVIFGAPYPSGFTWNLALTTGYDVRIDGDDNGDEFGDCVTAGDITGDGIDELIVPNELFSQYLFDSEGSVHIFRGRATWSKNYSIATAPADITLLGDRKYDSLGAAAVVGDFNGDTVLDLAAAAPGADAGAHTTQRGDGFVYGLLGSAAYQTGTHTIDYATATPDFLLVGEHEENLGAELSAGDFNGDGFADIAAAQRFGGPATNGTVDVLFGRSFIGNPTFTANVDTDVRIVGAAQDRIGFSMGAADVDSNGVDEVVFGTPFNNGDYPDEAGTVYVFDLLDGDYDGDGDRDLADFAAFQQCLASLLPAGEHCYIFDDDHDGLVDLDDLPAFVDALTGPTP